MFCPMTQSSNDRKGEETLLFFLTLKPFNLTDCFLITLTIVVPWKLNEATMLGLLWIGWIFLLNIPDHDSGIKPLERNQTRAELHYFHSSGVHIKATDLYGYFMLIWNSPLPQPPHKSWTMALVTPVTGSKPLPFPEPLISTHIPQPRDFWKSSRPAATLIQPGWEDIGERGSKAHAPPPGYSP